MEKLAYKYGNYSTSADRASMFSSVLSSASFYRKMASIVFRASSKAKHHKYGDAEWAESSLEILRALEGIGVKFEITGLDNLSALEEPCVFISNHMSTLETFVLPAIIEPFRDVTFVVKQGLVDYPVFKYVMRSRNPITVGRTNPREDLRAVLEGGTDRLKAGRSVIIFPQTTRASVFDPETFNTIGIKLARKAEVPVFPLALKTDAWGNGRYLKDFGKIDPEKKVYFAFGRPFRIKGRGDEGHKDVLEFISNKLREWHGL